MEPALGGEGGDVAGDAAGEDEEGAGEAEGERRAAGVGGARVPVGVPVRGTVGTVGVGAGREAGHLAGAGEALELAQEERGEGEPGVQEHDVVEAGGDAEEGLGEGGERLGAGEVNG